MVILPQFKPWSSFQNSQDLVLEVHNRKSTETSKPEAAGVICMSSLSLAQSGRAFVQPEKLDRHRSGESPLHVSRTLVSDTCFHAQKPLKGHQELQGLGALHRALETKARGHLSAKNTCHLFPTGIPPPHRLEKCSVGHPLFGYKGDVRVQCFLVKTRARVKLQLRY